MSEEQLRRGLQDTLDRLQREGTLEWQDATMYGVEQHLELARTDWERANDVARVRPTDFDFQYKMMYESLVTAAGALVEALGYRVRGADNTHEMTLRIAALALAPTDKDSAKLLDRLKDPARSIRRRATYERVGVVSKGERDQFFAQVSEILPVIETVACRLVGAAVPGHTWQAVDPGQ
jgi:hypothetical protein